MKREYNKKKLGASSQYGKCSYCGKQGEGYSFNSYFVCVACDKRRCKVCGIILDKTRLSCNTKSKIKWGDYNGYFKPGKLCKDCEEALTKK